MPGVADAGCVDSLLSGAASEELLAAAVDSWVGGGLDPAARGGLLSACDLSPRSISEGDCAGALAVETTGSDCENEASGAATEDSETAFDVVGSAISDAVRVVPSCLAAALKSTEFEGLSPAA